MAQQQDNKLNQVKPQQGERAGSMDNTKRPISTEKDQADKAGQKGFQQGQKSSR